jgi:hypothetical protein
MNINPFNARSTRTKPNAHPKERGVLNMETPQKKLEKLSENRRIKNILLLSNCLHDLRIMRHGSWILRINGDLFLPKYPNGCLKFLLDVPKDVLQHLCLVQRKICIKLPNHHSVHCE